jgi:hypothetical protein
MILSRSVVARIGLVVSVASLGFAPAARAVTVVLDYDSASMKDFLTAPYFEKGITTTVDAGHYEFHADATGADGDRAFNLDEQNLGLSKVTLTVIGGATFDALSLDVINPTDTAGEYTISAVGGGGGSIPAPTVAGPMAFGPGFTGISALVITQNSPGSFTFDELTVSSLPEPDATASLLASALLVFALRRRRAL